MRCLCEILRLLAPVVLTKSPADVAVVIPCHASAFTLLEEDIIGDKVEGLVAARTTLLEEDNTDDKVEGLVAARTRRREVATAPAGGAGSEPAANKGAGQLLCFQHGWLPFSSLCQQWQQQWHLPIQTAIRAPSRLTRGELVSSIIWCTSEYSTVGIRLQVSRLPRSLLLARSKSAARACKWAYVTGSVLGGP